MAATSDPRRVGRFDDEKLRRFVACRDEDDAEGAARWWRELTEDNFDRVRGWTEVNARRHKFSDEECEDAISRALARLWDRMMHTFRGASMGEWVKATQQLVEYACMDVQRAATRDHRRVKSLDETRATDAGDQSGRYDWRLDELSAEEYERDIERADAGAWIADLLPQLTSERSRAVIEDLLDGVPAVESAGKLGVKVENLYQLRTRALKELHKLKEPDDA